MSSLVNSMKVTRQDLNECTVLLDIVCGPDQVQAGFKKALKALGKQVKIPGFRPGSAPAAMVEKAIPEHELMNAAAEEILNGAYKQALKQEEIEPAGYPAVDFKKLERETSECEFSVKIPLPAKVELGDYSKVTAQKEEIDVTDQEVQAQIDELRKREGKHQKISDRGIQEGDMAVVNIKFKGEEGDGRSFMVVAGQTFPDLDKAISGMKVEEIKSAKLTFPDSFQEKDWANQTKDCSITIRSISAMQLPDLDEEFAKGFNLDSVEDLKDRVKDAIFNAKARSQQEQINEQLLDQVMQSSSIAVADTTWEGVADRRMQELEQELKNNNSTLEKYAEQNGMNLDELREALQAEAKLQVHRAVVIQNIFEKEGMQITDEEANRHFITIAQEQGVKPEDLQQFAKEYGAQLREEVIYRCMYSQVLGHLHKIAFGEQTPESAE